MAQATTKRHETGLTGLVALTPEQLPFDPTQDIRAFLLQRPTGNILVYSTTTLARDADVLERAGGVSRHYLNHHHEALFPADVGAPLFVHTADREQAEEAFLVRGSFDRRHSLDDDFEVIPIPGHTPGATAYLWDSGEHRMLFTGDSLYLDRGRWSAAVLESSDRETYLESLALMKELDFDVLVPWAATRGTRPHALTNRDDARAQLDAVIERVSRGASS